MKKLILYITIIGASLFVGYKTGFNKAQNVNEEYRKEIETETFKNNPVPQCFGNKCPEYQVFDVDGDDRYESVVTEYTTMTQQAGRVWIIKDGKVLFKSDQLAQISVAPTTNEYPNNGFLIYYATESPMAGEEIFLNSFKIDFYVYKDDQYVLIKTEKAN